MKCETVLSSVDNLDKAAVLVTLGFECYGRHVVRDVDLGSATSTHRDSAYLWQFGQVSAGGLKLDEVSAEYALGMPAGRCLKLPGAVGAARLALHNYRVLRKVLKQGAPLWVDDLLGCCRLGNFANAEGSREVRRMVVAERGKCCRAEYAAVLCALGYVPAGFYCGEGQVWVEMEEREGRAAVAAQLLLLNDERWLHEINNFEPGAVALLAIRNRGHLLQEAHPGETLRVHKNGLVGLVSRGADECVTGELCKRLNV